MGIDLEIFFVIGVSDGVLFNFGVNVIKKGEIVVIIGISGVICMIID